MNEKIIYTNRLYDGKDILDFTTRKLFEEGDEVLAIDGGVVTKYTYIKCNTGEFFLNMNGTGSDVRPSLSIDLLDLVKCKFIILLKERGNIVFLDKN